jgi:hypothetical protein
MRTKNKIIFNLLLLPFLAACGSETISSLASPDDGEETSYTIPDSGSWSYSKKIMYVQDKGLITGKKATVDTSKWKLTGTDLGFSFYDSDIKRFYSIFGDTTSNGGGIWNSNMTLYTDDLDFSNGINWQGKLPGQYGTNSQITPVSKRIANSYGYTYDKTLITSTDVSTTIPTGACIVNGTYYVFYMEVGEFQDNGEWDVFASGAVKSTDKGQTWSVVPSLKWISKDADGVEGNAKNFGQIFPLVVDDYVYIYGIPGGRSGGVKLGRVATSDIDDFSSYQYYSGLDSSSSPIWKDGNAGLNAIKESEDSYIVSPSCGELCVCYEPYLQRYMMSYMQNNSQIVIRRSVNPWGEWSSSDVIMKQSDLSGLYGGMTSPALFNDGGRQVYFFVSEWFPTYNVHQIEVVFN